MKTTIDAAGRVVVPKRLREQLGFAAGTELDIEVVDAHLELSIPSQVRIEDGPHGPRFAADTDERLTTAQVRELVERGRR
jgi:AbrB family looped-hinge helix DNA binding protein